MRGPSVLLRALVQCYPRPFRDRYAREVEESARVLLQRAWQRGFASGLRVTMSIIVDLIRSVLTERQLARLRGDMQGGGRFGTGNGAQDLREAVRQLRRRPAHAVAVVLTLTLAVGGVSAVFAMADPVLFRPLSNREPDRIFIIRAESERGRWPISESDWRYVREHTRSFESMGNQPECDPAFLHDQFTDGGIRVCEASPGYFDALGVAPHAGRTFTAGEYRSVAPVALITHAFWTSHFGRRADAIGAALTLHPGRTLTVVGVLPRWFVYGDFNNQPPDLFTPVDVPRPGARDHLRFAFPIVRLKPGVSEVEAREDVQRVLDAAAREVPALAQSRFFSPNRRAMLRSYAGSLFVGVRPTLTWLLGVTGVVLVLAGANLVHLHLARFAGRRRELATRAAIGATRARLVRMLVAEALLLAALGTAGALVLGRWLLAGVLAALPEQAGMAHTYRAIPAAMDARVTVAMFVLSALTLVVCAYWPIRRRASLDVRPSQLTSFHSGHGRRGRASLLFTQAGVATTLSVTALLLAGNFVRLSWQDVGFNPYGVWVAGPHPAGRNTEISPRQVGEAIERGVEEATGSDAALGYAPGSYGDVAIGRSDQELTHPAKVRAFAMSSEGFALFAIRPVRGRLLTPHESRSGAPVVVIDERTASLLWPGKDPLGRATRDERGVVREVVGVVASITTVLAEGGFHPGVAIVPLPNEPEIPPPVLWRGPAPASLAAALRISLEPLNLFDYQIGHARFFAILLGVLGSIAIALAAVGLSAVVRNGVVQRTAELGIRTALGADPRALKSMVVRQALAPALLGTALGTAICLWAAGLLRALLPDFEPNDPWMFAAGAAAVALLTLVAALGPARRAARVDPLTALRTE